MIQKTKGDPAYCEGVVQSCSSWRRRSPEWNYSRTSVLRLTTLQNATISCSWKGLILVRGEFKGNATKNANLKRQVITRCSDRNVEVLLYPLVKDVKNNVVWEHRCSVGTLMEVVPGSHWVTHFTEYSNHIRIRKRMRFCEKKIVRLRCRNRWFTARNGCCNYFCTRNRKKFAFVANVNVLISIAGLGFRFGLGHRFLYYAGFFHWFRFRLWSCDWNVCNRDGDLSLDWDRSLKWVQYPFGKGIQIWILVSGNMFCIILCSHRVWNPSLNLNRGPSPNLAMEISSIWDWDVNVWRLWPGSSIEWMPVLETRCGTKLLIVLLLWENKELYLFSK